MKHLLTLSVVILVATITVVPAASIAAAEEKVFTAVFGSCNKHDKEQSFWTKTVLPTALANSTGLLAAQQQHKKPLNNKVDALVWLGDIVYHDHMPFGMVWPYFSRLGDLEEMEHRWKVQHAVKPYVEFKKHTKHVIGVWDDHDASDNDATRDSDHLVPNQQFFLDFLDVPKSSSPKATALDKQRRDGRSGVYSFHRLDFLDSAVSSSSSTSNKKPHKFGVCFILLDVRTNRFAPHVSGEADVLGEQQAEWLDKVLRTGRDPHDDDADKNHENGMIKNIDDVCVVTFIGSGVQVFEDSLPTENWGEHHRARDQLLRSLLKSGARRFVFLSGDIHMANANRLRSERVLQNSVSGAAVAGKPNEDHGTFPYYESDKGSKKFELCPESPFREVGQDLWEITSSGLTHEFTIKMSHDWYNYVFPSPQRRFGHEHLQRNFGTIQVKCANSSLLESCRVFVGVHDIVSGKNVVEVEPEFFGLLADEKKKKNKNREATNEALCGPDPMKHPESYSLPVYEGPILVAVMFVKGLVPFFNELGRLQVIFIIIYAIVFAALLVVLVLLSWVWKCLRVILFGSGKHKHLHRRHGKKQNDSEGKEHID